MAPQPSTSHRPHRSSSRACSSSSGRLTRGDGKDSITITISGACWRVASPFQPRMCPGATPTFSPRSTGCLATARGSRCSRRPRSTGSSRSCCTGSSRSSSIGEPARRRPYSPGSSRSTRSTPRPNRRTPSAPWSLSPLCSCSRKDAREAACCALPGRARSSGSRRSSARTS